MDPDLLWRICERAGELSEMTLKQLRLLHPDNVDGRPSGCDKSLSHRELVSDILFEEFGE